MASPTTRATASQGLRSAGTPEASTDADASAYDAAWYGEDDLPPGVTSVQQEIEYRELLAAGFFEAEQFDESPEPAFWSLAALARYEDIPLAS